MGTTHHWRFGNFGFDSAMPAAPLLGPDGSMAVSGTYCPEWAAHVPHWFPVMLCALPAMF
jgi:hypothetical protein